MPRHHRTVFVALSGGVDSAVAAALLVKTGRRCVGVFIESWSQDFGPSKCTQTEDRRDAARVAAKLDMPFLVLPCAEEYRRRVLASFLTNLQQGLTPNPDVDCNQEIKFGIFRESALAAGADAIATGHYAQLERVRGHSTPVLKKGQDVGKDQSYFLARVDSSAFAKTLFPVGHLAKVDVRRMARRLSLPVAIKPDSQGLCFVGAVTLPTFLRHFFTQQSGPVTTTEGTVVGQHRGLANYTIGQRHGFGAAHGVPQYVVRKDMATNTLIVAANPKPLLASSVTVKEWRTHPCFDSSAKLRAKLRYRQPDQVIKSISNAGEVVTIQFAEPQRAVTAGQVLAVYDDDRLVASGFIV